MPIRFSLRKVFYLSILTVTTFFLSLLFKGDGVGKFFGETDALTPSAHADTPSVEGGGGVEGGAEGGAEGSAEGSGCEGCGSCESGCAVTGDY